MNNPFNLSGKKILITGASSGIGRQIAISVALSGADLVITGRNTTRLAETFALLNGDNHQMLIADINSEEDADLLVENCNSLDGIVLASGILKTLPFKFVTAEALNDIMNSNFQSPVILLNKLIKMKKLNKGSSIIFISSIGGTLIGTIGNSMYSASKGAINSIQKVLALELAPQKIRVNSISPGMIKTPLWQEGSISNQQLLEDEKRYPLGYGRPEDVAFAAIYLLSDASRWATGSSLILDGGFSIQ